jgi:hypothetical protein
MYKIVKEQIYSEQIISKIRVAKYSKNLFKPAVRDNPLDRTIQGARDNPSHLTNLHPIYRS